MTNIVVKASDLKTLIEVLQITTEKKVDELDEMRQYAFLFSTGSDDEVKLSGATANESVGGTYGIDAEFGELPASGVAVHVNKLGMIKQATTTVGKEELLSIEYDGDNNILTVSSGSEDTNDKEALTSFIAPEGSAFPVGDFKKLLTKSDDEEPESEELYSKDQLAPLLKVGAKLKEPITFLHGNPETVSRVRIGEWHGWYLPDEANFDDIEESEGPAILDI